MRNMVVFSLKCYDLILRNMVVFSLRCHDLTMRNMVVFSLRCHDLTMRNMVVFSLRCHDLTMRNMVVFSLRCHDLTMRNMVVFSLYCLDLLMRNMPFSSYHHEEYGTISLKFIGLTMRNMVLFPLHSHYHTLRTMVLFLFNSHELTMKNMVLLLLLMFLLFYVSYQYPSFKLPRDCLLITSFVCLLPVSFLQTPQGLPTHYFFSMSLTSTLPLNSPGIAYSLLLLYVSYQCPSFKLPRDYLLITSFLCLLPVPFR